MTRGRRLAVVLLVGAVGVLAPATSAQAAASGRIALAQRDGGTLQVVFQADGLPAGVIIEPDSVKVTIGGTEIPDPDVSQLDAGTSVSRTTVLAIDTSRSMAADNKFAAAKAAATAFLDSLPPDVRVGVVTFADVTDPALAPTADRAAVKTAIDALTLSTTTGTALYDGAALAADQTGDDGVRNVLLLSDGNEYGNSTTTLPEAVGHATDDGVRINSVYIGPEAVAPTELSELVTGTQGTIAKAGTADLSTVFQQAAEDIKTQISITGALPAGVASSAQVVVTAKAGSESLRASAISSAAGAAPAPTQIAGPTPVEASSSSLFDSATLPYLLGAFFIGLLIIVYVALGTMRRDEKSGRVRRRLSLYTLTGRAPVKQEETTTALGSSQVARSAVELAGRVVDKRDFEAELALRLEAAGVPLRAAEWMLIHLAIAIGAALLLLLISGGQILPTVLGLAAGLGLPWAYLVVKESRRTSAFLAQLPDTLQLIAGSLSAGYSMPQAMDTVVREGSQPVTGEFNRALVEARLGVPMEDAMEGIADRMKSKDFSWVVMAIRIQREVGGNLAELLTTVSGTLRERETLRRQVKVLSAEGRLSAWILGLLPPVFALYLALAQPTYLKPLISEVLGWLLLGGGIVLLAVGALWMRKAVKVEV
jgi:tight adherence protein B